MDSHRLQSELERSHLMMQQPLTLTKGEINEERWPITRLDRAVLCRAWVRWAHEPRRSLFVDAQMSAFNEVACEVEWIAYGGQFGKIEMRCWVWRSAVRVVPPRDRHKAGV